jgi:hypothetical protein
MLSFRRAAQAALRDEAPQILQGFGERTAIERKTQPEGCAGEGISDFRAAGASPGLYVQCLPHRQHSICLRRILISSSK